MTCRYPSRDVPYFRTLAADFDIQWLGTGDPGDEAAHADMTAQHVHLFLLTRKAAP